MIPWPQILLLTLPLTPPPYSCKCSFLLIPCARFSAPNPKFKMFISLLKTAQFLKDCLKNLIWFIQAVVLYNFSWSVSHPTPTLYPVCVVLSVNQSVSQLIVLINFSVSKWVSAATLPLPPTQWVLLSVNQSVRQLIVSTSFSVSQWVSATTLPLPMPLPIVRLFVSQPVC